MTHVFALMAVMIGPAGQVQTSPAGQAPANSPQLSLADTARAARQARTEKAGRQHESAAGDLPQLTPEQRGTVRDNVYINDVFHMRIDLAGWEPLSEDRIAMNQAMARIYVNPDLRPSPYKVLWVGDGRGRTIILSIMPLPPNPPRDLDDLKAGMKKIVEAQLHRIRDLRESDEPVLLGDPEHKFAAFRLNVILKDIPIAQSEQFSVSNGFLFSFVVTGRSDQEVSDTLQSLKTGMAWTRAAR